MKELSTKEYEHLIRASNGDCITAVQTLTTYLWDSACCLLLEKRGCLVCIMCVRSCRLGSHMHLTPLGKIAIQCYLLLHSSVDVSV